MYKLDLHRVWMREDGNLEDSNEDEKSEKILKNVEVPKIARIVLSIWKSRKELLGEPHTYEFAVCPPTLPVWSSKRFPRRPGRPEEDVDALLETSDANFRSRRRVVRLSARPL